MPGVDPRQSASPRGCEAARSTSRGTALAWCHDDLTPHAYVEMEQAYILVRAGRIERERPGGAEATGRIAAKLARAVEALAVVARTGAHGVAVDADQTGLNRGVRRRRGSRREDGAVGEPHGPGLGHTLTGVEEGDGVGHRMIR